MSTGSRAGRGGRPAAGARPSGGGEWTTWLIPAAFVLVAAITTATWFGGRVASAVSGHGWTGPRWQLIGFLQLGHTATAWPSTPRALIWVCVAFVVAVELAAAGAVALLLHRSQRGNRRSTAARAMARPGDVAGLHTRAAGKSALRLRPTLADSHKNPRNKPGRVPVAERGVTLGKLVAGGNLLQSSWEDVILAVFAPRSGKTTGLAVPALLDAPGPAVACSNKADLYVTTSTLRRQSGTERCTARSTASGGAGGAFEASGAPEAYREWVFDPQHVAHMPQGFWWNPLRAPAGRRWGLDDATRLAGGFTMAVADDDNREIWGPAATELLANLLLAAHAGGLTLLDAYRWLYDAGSNEPDRLLREHGHVAAAESLVATQQLAAETRDSVYFTARAGCASLRDVDIAAWVTPQRGVPEFVPDEFVESTADTLYLLSKNVSGGTSAAAIVAALTTEVRVAAERAGERRGGRVDPPLVLVLDEAANICRIRDLPEQYSHMGSRSIVPITILQSYAQGERVWGKGGMKELWGAATIKLVGSGADDADFAEDISRVIGEHDVTTTSVSNGSGGRSTSRSVHRERILPAAEVRALPKSRAVLLATGTTPALIRLLPWFESPRARSIAAAERDAAERLRRRAAGEPDTDPNVTGSVGSVGPVPAADGPVHLTGRGRR